MTTTEHADWIDEIQFGYSCSRCNEECVHGNGGIGYTHNRTENRGVHCDCRTGNVNIVIDDKTERKLNSNNMRIYVQAIQNNLR